MHTLCERHSQVNVCARSCTNLYSGGSSRLGLSKVDPLSLSLPRTNLSIGFFFVFFFGTLLGEIATLTVESRGSASATPARKIRKSLFTTVELT